MAVKIPLTRFREVGCGFYNLKTRFYCREVIGGLMDIGTHMSLLRLESSGNFLVVDVCFLDTTAKKEFDSLTDNGRLIVGVVASHPFHTTYFESFYRMYPDLKYFGTPRHIRNIPSIPWVGDISHKETRDLWEPEVLFISFSTLSSVVRCIWYQYV